MIPARFAQRLFDHRVDPVFALFEQSRETQRAQRHADPALRLPVADRHEFEAAAAEIGNHALCPGKCADRTKCRGTSLFLA